MSDVREVAIRCYLCNRPITWEKGQEPCCEECVPVRQQNQAHLASAVHRMKQRDQDKKQREAAEGSF